MEDNPYEPPGTFARSRRSSVDRRNVAASLRIPSMALMALSLVAMVLDAVILVHAFTVDAEAMLLKKGPEEGRELIVANVVANGGLLIVHVIVLYGSWNMRKVRSYPNALTAAFVSIVPCYSPVVILGMPFGIWALVILRRGGVEGAFRFGAD